MLEEIRIGSLGVIDVARPSSWARASPSSPARPVPARPCWSPRWVCCSVAGRLGTVRTGRAPARVEGVVRVTGAATSSRPRSRRPAARRGRPRLLARNVSGGRAGPGRSPAVPPSRSRCSPVGRAAGRGARAVRPDRCWLRARQRDALDRFAGDAGGRRRWRATPSSGDGCWPARGRADRGHGASPANVPAKRTCSGSGLGRDRGRGAAARRGRRAAARGGAAGLCGRPAGWRPSRPARPSSSDQGEPDALAAAARGRARPRDSVRDHDAGGRRARPTASPS